MDKMEFTSEEKAQMVQKVNMYFREELDQELGGFQAEFLIDFFAEEMGGFFYNRGLYDAETVMSEKLRDISDELMQLEKAVR